MPTYRLHDTTGDDLGLIEHPAPNVEPGDVIMLPDRTRQVVRGSDTASWQRVNRLVAATRRRLR